VSAFATVLKLRGIGRIALGTEHLQFSAAFPAKLQTFRILELAFGTLHDSPPDVGARLAGTQTKKPPRGIRLLRGYVRIPSGNPSP
jgi:hypothetical protein